AGRGTLRPSGGAGDGASGIAVTLGRLVLAWLVVAAWFVAAAWAGRRLLAAARPAPGPLLGEAAVVTLFASLWFDSLGSGGWWLLFLLVGLLAAFPVRLQGIAAAGLPRRAEILLALLDTARYLGAGAILAWRLR
ncbi:MAG TPA: hypothetical protein VNI61_12735, partial [Gemmatimonadales bacterium]|nr:hypothetical protein [Gemmatimonadales bacterium]